MKTTSQNITVRVPGTLVRAIDDWAKRLQVNRSEAARDLISRSLEKYDLWPPSATDERTEAIPA